MTKQNCFALLKMSKQCKQVLKYAHGFWSCDAYNLQIFINRDLQTGGSYRLSQAAGPVRVVEDFIVED